MTRFIELVDVNGVMILISLDQIIYLTPYQDRTVLICRDQISHETKESLDSIKKRIIDSEEIIILL